MDASMSVQELLVKTGNPAALDQILHELGGCVCQQPDGSYVVVESQVYAVRAFGRPLDFLRFAITAQGYGEVVGMRDVPEVTL